MCEGERERERGREGERERERERERELSNLCAVAIYSTHTSWRWTRKHSYRHGIIINSDFIETF